MFKLFCKHDWEVLSDITTKSQIEHIMDVAPNISNYSYPGYCNLALRKRILIYKCNKCGKLEKLVEKI